ncbi:MAG: hypothetical protein ACFFBD_10915 [Candidatus Hodarchaeota archaeon]
MTNKPFSWIARQPYSIRYGEMQIKSDNEHESEAFLSEMPTSEDIEFKRGRLWPTFVLVENLWSPNPEDTDIYLRLLRKNRDIIVDVWKGHDKEIASQLARKYNIPIYSIYNHQKRKRLVVHRVKSELFTT